MPVQHVRDYWVELANSIKQTPAMELVEHV